MSNKSKNKGKSWERDVCNFLSELYNQSFIRVPNSGAFVGGKNEFRKETLSTEQIHHLLFWFLSTHLAAEFLDSYDQQPDLQREF